MMEISDLFTVAAVVGIGSHLAIRHAPVTWQRAKQRHREVTLRRIAAVAKNARVPKPAFALSRTPRPAQDLSRYFVPVGLRLDQARAIIRDARRAEVSDTATPADTP